MEELSERVKLREKKTLKSSISEKSGKKGRMSSIFSNPSVSFKNAIAFLMFSPFVAFPCWTTCLAIMSQSFFLNSSLSSTLSASSFAVSGSTCRFVAVWEKVGTLGFNNLGLFMGNYMAHTLNIEMV